VAAKDIVDEDVVVDQTAFRAAGGSETVLVVEDESAVRYLTRLLLERAGYHVLDADGPGAAEAQSLDGVDLVITDVKMPGSSGPAMFAKLLETYPRLKVIYMSGYTDDIVGRGGQIELSRAFLQKPFSNDDLLRMVRAVLDR
jgi:two-component system cell cycle sensor histidine kinase/response regulator CckA